MSSSYYSLIVAEKKRRAGKRPYDLSTVPWGSQMPCMV